MGWAQRQKLGDPIAKAVLQSMCYVMRDDTLLVYVGIPTLEELTEYEDRALRKAIDRMEKAGVLRDTGKKKNNVTVYRIPGYEQWLSALNESPPANGGGSPTDLAALSQLSELAREKSVVPGTNDKPPRKGEGHDASPPVDASKPSRPGAQALPSTGGNLPDLPRSSGSADARATPSGARPAQDKPQKAKLPAPPPEFDEARARSYWWNTARAYALSSAGLFGICPPRPSVFDEIPNDAPSYARDQLTRACSESTAWAISEHRAAFPLSDARGKEITKQLETRLDVVLAALRPSTPAERAA